MLLGKDTKHNTCRVSLRGLLFWLGALGPGAPSQSKWAASPTDHMTQTDQTNTCCVLWQPLTLFWSSDCGSREQKQRHAAESAPRHAVQHHCRGHLRRGSRGVPQWERTHRWDRLTQIQGFKQQEKLCTLCCWEMVISSLGRFLTIFYCTRIFDLYWASLLEKVIMWPKLQISALTAT